MYKIGTTVRKKRRAVDASSGALGMGEVIGEKSGTKWAVHPPVDMFGNQATLYVSPETGLRGMLIATGEPLSNVHVVIATEANTNAWSHKDDGLPHTLEHAIFLGSELYPFKGILDKLANRSLADGTNAWTTTDHTCYTLTTAGHEGALNLFPIYADHILYPCLSDSSFTTEVHHVNGLGEDKGVVYCEMQGRENTEGSLVDRAVLALLYPGSGYAAETGGKLSNLRALTNAQVRQYHAENYVPSNILFVLSGAPVFSWFGSIFFFWFGSWRARSLIHIWERFASLSGSSRVRCLLPFGSVFFPPFF